LDEAFNQPAPAPPVWANYNAQDYLDNDDLIDAHRLQFAQSWLSGMLGESVHAKMTLFWHNHFVTELRVYECNSALWNYYALLHTYAFGNFRLMTQAIGKSAAMLIYLNGNENVAGEPNENYARELMELFTMGEGNNYTQADIVNMSRALTGWQANDDLCTPPGYVPSLHDNGSKTIFGITNNHDYNSANNLIFVARANEVAKHIATKIYKHFLYQYPDDQFVNALGEQFKNGGWEILPMLKTFFKSQHFFEGSLLSAMIKSPFECLISTLKTAQVQYPNQLTDDFANLTLLLSSELGQQLMNPPNVAGWQGYRSWINETTLTSRWVYSGYLVYAIYTNETAREYLRQVAITRTGGSNNPTIITDQLVEYFIHQDLDNAQRLAALANFKAGIPENYFQDGSWNLNWNEAPYQIVNLLYYLVRLPEFQLS
jgi:uncharacterized protein (DUF1800 family)